MAYRSYEQQLDDIQGIIGCLTSGDGIQSYTIKDRSYTYADLDTLYKQEARLMAIVERRERGGIRCRRLVPE